MSRPGEAGSEARNVWRGELSGCAGAALDDDNFRSPAKGTIAARRQGKAGTVALWLALAAIIAHGFLVDTHQGSGDLDLFLCIGGQAFGRGQGFIEFGGLVLGTVLPHACLHLPQCLGQLTRLDRILPVAVQ